MTDDVRWLTEPSFTSVACCTWRPSTPRWQRAAPGSRRYGVAAHAGGDPVRDLALRRTGLAPPLFLPAVLLAAAVLARRRDRVGIAATVAAGLVGLALTAGSTLNLPADLAAARDAGSPVGLTTVAVFHWFLGPALTMSAVLGLRNRRRRLTRSSEVIDWAR